MKTNKLILALIMLTASYSLTVNAHDPKEHAKEKEVAKCEKMQDMGKMDKNDPVVMAMMKKCQKMPADMHNKEQHVDMPMKDQDDAGKQDEHGDHH